MCLAQVVVRTPSGDAVEMTDVVDVVADGGALRVSTLFGEVRSFSGMRIDRIDLRSGVISFVEAGGNG